MACCTVCIASAGDWQERVVDLESKVSAQTKEIEMQIEAIATLENQKLDLLQGNLCIFFFFFFFFVLYVFICEINIEFQIRKKFF